METIRYQVLLVGDTGADAILSQVHAALNPDSPIQLTQAATYSTAIWSVEQQQWDAILVMREFDSHTGLEFVHHARLLGTHAPLVLMSEEYEDGLAYKAQRIGAADCISMQWMDMCYLKGLLMNDCTAYPQAAEGNEIIAFLRAVEVL